MAMDKDELKFSDLKFSSSSIYDFLAQEKKWSKDNFQNELFGNQLEELSWRVSARKWYGRGLMFLLFAQNIAIYWLVWLAYQQGQLESLGLVLGALITGTLAETAYIVRIIVTELFKDIKYGDYGKKQSSG